MRDSNQLKNIIIAAASFFIVVLVLILLMRLQKDGEKNEDWRVEGQVVRKETIIREDKDNGTEEVFLIDCEDEDGVVHTFELTDTALSGNITAEDAYKEIKTGRAYRFKVGWRNRQAMDKDGHYPSIYGAASLVEFNLSVAAEEEQAKQQAKDRKDGEDISEGSVAADEAAGIAGGIKEAENEGQAGVTRAAGNEGPAGATGAVGGEGPAGATGAAENEGSAGITRSADRERPAETTARESSRESDGSRSTQEEEIPSSLEIGGIKIERVDETIDEKLLESVEEQVKAELEESIRAELEESLEAEKRALREELEKVMGSDLLH